MKLHLSLLYATLLSILPLGLFAVTITVNITTPRLPTDTWVTKIGSDELTPPQTIESLTRTCLDTPPDFNFENLADSQDQLLQTFKRILAFYVKTPDGRLCRKPITLDLKNNIYLVAEPPSAKMPTATDVALAVQTGQQPLDILVPVTITTRSGQTAVLQLLHRIPIQKNNPKIPSREAASNVPLSPEQLLEIKTSVDQWSDEVDKIMNEQAQFWRNTMNMSETRIEQEKRNFKSAGAINSLYLLACSACNRAMPHQTVAARYPLLVKYTLPDAPGKAELAKIFSLISSNRLAEAKQLLEVFDSNAQIKKPPAK